MYEIYFNKRLTVKANGSLIILVLVLENIITLYNRNLPGLVRLFFLK